MADRTVKKPIGILCDVLSKVKTFIFPVDLMILDCKVDFKFPTFLERPFLATGRELLDMESRQLMFSFNDKKVIFNIYQSMKRSNDLNMNVWHLVKSKKPSCLGPAATLNRAYLGCSPRYLL